MGNAVAALALGVALEEFTYLEEEHHEHCFGELRLGTRQEADAEGTDGGDRHKEMFIKGIALQDTLPRLVQRFVAY